MWSTFRKVSISHQKRKGGSYSSAPNGWNWDDSLEGKCSILAQYYLMITWSHTSKIIQGSCDGCHNENLLTDHTGCRSAARCPQASRCTLQRTARGGTSRNSSLILLCSLFHFWAVLGPEGELLWKQLMYVMFFLPGQMGTQIQFQEWLSWVGFEITSQVPIFNILQQAASSLSCWIRFFSIRKEAPSILDRQGTNQCKTQPDDSSTTEINVQ